jgi:hypothetical protein
MICAEEGGNLNIQTISSHLTCSLSLVLLITHHGSKNSSPKACKPGGDDLKASHNAEKIMVATKQQVHGVCRATGDTRHDRLKGAYRDGLHEHGRTINDE